MNSIKNLLGKNSRFLMLCALLLVGAINVHINLYNFLGRTGEFELHFIDVGQGDATLIKTPDNLYVLIDTGKPSGQLTKKLYQLMAGYKKLDLLILTHPDADHIEELINLQRLFSVDLLLWHKYQKSNEVINEIKSIVSKSEIANMQLDAGTDIQLGCCVFLDTVWPLAGFDTYNVMDYNQISYSFVLSYADKRFWLSGDLGWEHELDIVGDSKQRLPPVFMLKAGHHGSNSSTSEELLTKLNAEYAIISVGEDNTYGHPAAAVVDRLTKANVEILRTDIHGTVSVVHSSEGWLLKKGKKLEKQTIPL